MKGLRFVSGLVAIFLGAALFVDSPAVSAAEIAVIAKQNSSLSGTTWRGSYQYDTMEESETLSIEFYSSTRARANHIGDTQEWTYTISGNRVVMTASSGSTWTAGLDDDTLAGTMHFPGHGDGVFTLYLASGQPRVSGAAVGNAAPPAAAPYALSQLHARVREAVEEAREAESSAMETATRARQAAADAVRRGTRDAQNGLGYEDYTGAFAGDRYAGNFRGGYRTGLGVMTNAQNSNNSVGALRYEGDWLNGESHGLGVHYWVENERHAGHYSNNMFNGAGVYYYSDGRRYEGQWSNNTRSGYGVLWDAQGRVQNAGLWASHEFVRPAN
jgi:hypothetical protein